MYKNLALCRICRLPARLSKLKAMTAGRGSAFVDEETPLLQRKSTPVTPLPWAQFSIVLLLQLTEPLTSHVIHPFAPQVCCISSRINSGVLNFIWQQLVRDTGVTKGNESQVGYYVGILVSTLIERKILQR
jgi:hypothetical protein